MFPRLRFAAPETAHTAIALGGYQVGVGRTVPTLAALVGLTSLITGGLVLARSTPRGGVDDRRIPAVSVSVSVLVMGLVAAIVGGVHAVYSAGGLGTGNGLAGAVVAVVLGLIGTCLGGLALTRSRRAGVPPTPPAA